jgi:putative ABC transport system ATP-binding protein
LEAIEVRKTYHEGGRAYEILKGVDLQVEAGEVVALEGRSGSGKTTLLSILGCVLQPCSGRVILDGREIDSETAETARRECLGFVFQHCNLIPALNATHAVSYVLRLKGWRARASREEASRLLDLVGLSERKLHFPGDLSGGEKQRVAIARAMAGSPPLILADEPTANLDSESASEILELFRQVAKQHDRALLVVTHDRAVRTIADSVYKLEDGRLQSVPDRAAAG